MKSWVKLGAVCEVNGEGAGNFFRVELIDSASNCVWLYQYLPNKDGKGIHKYDLGWKSVKGCYRTRKCRKLEKEKKLTDILPFSERFVWR